MASRKYASLCLATLALALQQVSGLYFYLTEGQTKCFREELIKFSVCILTLDQSIDRNCT